jgi:predicted deacylase
MKWQNGWQQWEAVRGVTLDVFHWRGDVPGKNVLVTAGIHGDEYEGPAAVAQFVAGLDTSKLCGSLTAIPVANPPAFLAGTRTNPDGMNLARCFPGNCQGKPTERLAAALFDNLAGDLDFLIDLHSGGVEYLFLPVAGFYGDPHAGNPSFQAARQFGLPSLWKLPETAGVLSCEASRRGAVAIGNEYLGAGQLSLEGVTAYAEGIQRCLSGWNIYNSPCEPPPHQRLLVGDWQLASQSGIFRSHLALGCRVRAGERIGFTSGIDGTIVEEFFAPSDGILGGLRSKAYIREGNWAVLVQQESYVE